MGGCRITLSGALASYVWDGVCESRPWFICSVPPCVTWVLKSLLPFPSLWNEDKRALQTLLAFSTCYLMLLLYFPTSYVSMCEDSRRLRNKCVRTYTSQSILSACLLYTWALVTLGFRASLGSRSVPTETPFPTTSGIVFCFTLRFAFYSELVDSF